MSKDYAIYDTNENCVFIGSAKMCAQFMGLTMSSFYCNVSRTKSGELKGRSRFRAYEIEEDVGLNYDERGGNE